MDAPGMTQFDRGRTQYRPDTSYGGNIARGLLYKWDRSADNFLNSGETSRKQVEQPQRTGIHIPVFHEQTGLKREQQNRHTRRFDDRSGSCTYGQFVNSCGGENIGYNRNRIADNTSSGLNNSVNSDAIVFSKNSGVTRIPATRVRRHSVQYDGSGSLLNNRHRNAIPDRQHIIPVRRGEFSLPRSTPNGTQSGSNNKTNDIYPGYSKVKVLTPDASTTDRKPFFAQKVDNVNSRDLSGRVIPDVYQVQSTNKQTNDTNYSSIPTTVPSKVVNKVSEKPRDRQFIKQISAPASTRPRLGESSGVSRVEMPGVTAQKPTDRSFIPVDLTPAQSDNSSHIVCYKNSNNIPSSGYSSDFSPGVESLWRKLQGGPDMGVVATELPRQLSMESENSGRGGLRQGSDDHIRVPSRTSLTLARVPDVRGADRRTYESDDATSDAEQNYVKRNIHVRRHSVSTPAAFRQSQKPQLLREFQDWSRPPANVPSSAKTEDTLGKILAHARATSTDTPRSTTKVDHGPQQPVGLDKASCGMVPIRRYSVTYIPRTDASDSDSGAPMAPVQSKTNLAPPTEKSKNKKRFTRRRCRPLSIVNESVSPISGPEEKMFDGVTTVTSSNQPIEEQSNATNQITNYQEPPTTEVNIARDDKNVNIVAGGNVHISLNSDKPLSMVGRSAPDKSSEFSLWTEGSELTNSRTKDTVQGPLGVWRQGNVMVDSVSPMIQGNQYQVPGMPAAQAPLQMYPGVPMMQPMPMMYYNPYLDPQMQAAYANQYAGCPLQAPTPQDKSLYSPLSLDIMQTPRPYMPMMHPGQVPPHGLLQAAGNGHQQNVVNGTQPMPPANTAKPNELPHDVSADDELSPQPQIDVREMIAGFEKRTDVESTKPEFCSDYGSRTGSRAGSRAGSREGSRSRRVSVDTTTSLPVTASGSQTDSGSELGYGHKKIEQGQEMCCQTDKLPEQDEQFKLKVDDRDDKWTDPTTPVKEPTTIHAYIAEMSLSEVRFGDQNDKNKS